jgi:Flp pilus assembly protein TadG
MMPPEQQSRNVRRRRGSAVIELSLLVPWFLFLFIGMVDVGFYTYALIAVENATRVAAEYTMQSSSAATDQTHACIIARAELATLPGVSSTTTCGSSPLVVTASAVTGPDGNSATSVSVTYSGMGLVPIPGLLTNSLQFTRTVQMRVKP